MIHELFICRCHHPEHQLIFNWDDSEDGDVYVTVHLVKCDFLKRLWYAIKYIFGHTSIYGAFDEFIMNEDDAPRLKKVVEVLETLHYARMKDDEPNNIPSEARESNMIAGVDGGHCLLVQE